MEHGTPFRAFLYPLTTETSPSPAPTPSLLHNNLISHDNVHGLAYIHKEELQWIDIDGNNLDSLAALRTVQSTPMCDLALNPISRNRSLPLALMNQGEITCADIMYSTAQKQAIILLGKGNMLYLFDADQQTVLATHKVGEADDSFHITGITHLPDNKTFAVGVSNGWVQTCEFGTRNMVITQGPVKRMAEGAVTGLTGGVLSLVHQNNMQIFVIASDDGTIRVMDSNLSEIHLIGPFLLENEKVQGARRGDPVTSIKVMKNHIIAAFGSGRIRVIDAQKGALRCEISAHARWITAIDIDPDRNLVVSVSEDTYLCVHSIDLESSAESSVSILVCEEMRDNLLTGVKFLPGAAHNEDRAEHKVITVTSYDKDYMVFFSLDDDCPRS